MRVKPEVNVDGEERRRRGRVGLVRGRLAHPVHMFGLGGEPEADFIPLGTTKTQY